MHMIWPSNTALESTPIASSVPHSRATVFCRRGSAFGRCAAFASMKFIITCFICWIALFRADAADEPLIPAPLNTVLLKIRPGMNTNQVLAVLSPSYRKVEVQEGIWSGQPGYMDYKLDKRFTLSVSSVMWEGKQLVHDDLFFCVFDWQNKRRVDLTPYYWEGRSHKEPVQK
jgi:hypothetical protein